MFEKLQKIVRRYREEARGWFEANGSKLFLFLGMLVSIALAFEGGFLLGRDRQVEPIVITTPAPLCEAVVSRTEMEKVPSEEGKIPDVATAAGASTAPTSNNAGQSESESCVFVGSKNSDKYHLPKCSWAKRIKPENRVCFTSAADAESKGYKAGCVK